LSLAGAVMLLLLLGLVSAGAVWRYLARHKPAEHPPPIALEREALFPEPRLQLAPREDLRALRAWEEAALNSYGWIDRTAGVVRLPIERAMDLIVQRGLPVRAQDGTNPGSPSAEQQKKEGP
jgi:hypothetical protein